MAELGEIESSETLAKVWTAAIAADSTVNLSVSLADIWLLELQSILPEPADRRILWFHVYVGYMNYIIRE